MTIKDLGRWESLEMVQRYTRSVTFHDSLQDYTIDTKTDSSSRVAAVKSHLHKNHKNTSAVSACQYPQIRSAFCTIYVE